MSQVHDDGLSASQWHRAANVYCHERNAALTRLAVLNEAAERMVVAVEAWQWDGDRVALMDVIADLRAALNKEVNDE